jgi:acetyltransferase-like isoleucine patch superfamily enzyme
MSFKKKLLANIFTYYQTFKKAAFAAISKSNVIGTPNINQATIFEGEGRIYFESNVNLGYFPSPKFYEGSIYIEARSINAVIKIGENTFINNECVIVADKSSITIGRDALIGTGVEIMDSDFHNIENVDRKSADYNCKAILIGNNVFIGNNVKILKGVEIGDNCVIGNGSIVTKSFPENVIIAGIPAKIIRSI